MYKTPDNLSSERVNGGQRIKLQRGVVTGRNSEEFPRRQSHEIRLPPSCPSAGKVAISMELRPRDGFFITWTHNPSARASCRGTIERELGWPSQRVDPLFIHPTLDRTPTISPHGRFELPGARATTPSTQPPAKKLTQATHQPPPPFRENQLWKPAPLAHAFQRTKDRAPPLRMSPNLSIVFTKHLNSAATMPGRTVRRKGSQETGFRTPCRSTLGGRKTKDGWDKHKHGLQAHTKNQALPRDKQPTMFPPSTKPAPLETHHKVPHCNRHPTNPNQKRKPLLSMILPQVHLR